MTTSLTLAHDSANWLTCMVKIQVMKKVKHTATLIPSLGASSRFNVALNNQLPMCMFSVRTNYLDSDTINMEQLKLNVYRELNGALLTITE